MTTEKEVIRRIRNGDIQEFESLFRSSYISLVNYAQTILKDRDSAEEIVQQLFYVLWRDREKINIKSSLKGYLFRSVFNRCMHHIDHNNVIRRHTTGMKDRVENETNDPAEIMKYNELHEKVVSIIEKLPERCARIFCMSRFEGLKYSEIANELAISIKTVEANMGKALKVFRKELM